MSRTLSAEEHEKEIWRESMETIALAGMLEAVCALNAADAERARLYQLIDGFGVIGATIAEKMRTIRTHAEAWKELAEAQKGGAR